MKMITEFVRTQQNEGEIVTIQIQVTMAQNVTKEYDFLRSLEFKFNQVEADYIYAEFQTDKYEVGIQKIDELRKAGYSFESEEIKEEGNE